MALRLGLAAQAVLIAFRIASTFRGSSWGAIKIKSEDCGEFGLLQQKWCF